MPTLTKSPDGMTETSARLNRQYKKYPRAVPLRAFRWAIRFWWIPPVAYLCLVAYDAVPIWPRQGLASLRSLSAIVNLIERDDAVVIALSHSVLALAVLLILILSVRLHRWANLDLRTERGVLALRAERASPTFRLLTDQWHHEPYYGESDPTDVGPTVVVRDTGPTLRCGGRRAKIPPPKPADPLGYERFVKTMSRLIVASADSTPLAISIEGEWGIGKTSVMHMLLDQLDGRRFSTALIDHDEFQFTDWRCITIWFNAWKYRGTDVQRAFLNEVYEEIPHKWLLGPTMWLHMFGLAVDTASSILPFGALMARATKGLDERAKWRVRAEDDFQTILRRLRGWDGRHPLVVMFIDDLDRCAPTEVARVLEMMKLFFDTPGCVFVLGFDLKVVADSVRRDYRGVVGDGVDYLKKIVQVNYTLPVPSDSGFAKLLDASVRASGLSATFEALSDGIVEHEAHLALHEDEQREAFPKYVRLVARGTGGNPRELKRFLNTFVVNVQLIDREEYYPALCVLLLLQVHWVRCYFDIARRVNQGTFDTFVSLVEHELAIDQQPDPTPGHGEAGAHPDGEPTGATSATNGSDERTARAEPGAEDSPGSSGSREAERQFAPRSDVPSYAWLKDEDLRAFLTRYRLSDYRDAFAYLVQRVGLPATPPPPPTPPSEGPSGPTAQAVVEQAAEVAHEVAVAAVQQHVEEIVARLPKPSPEPDIPGPPFDIALLPEPEHFVSREDDLAQVVTRLRAGGQAAITGLFGLAGIGKTALAAVAVRRLYAEGRFPDGIAVILCQGLSDPREVLRRVLARFDPLRRMPESSDLAELSSSAHALLRGRDALVVLENVEPELPIEQVLQPLRDARLTVLLTARQTLQLAPDANIALDLLSDASALDLFAEWYGRADAAALTPIEREAAQRIVAALDRHTLAVKLAGAYAREAGRDLPGLARELVADPLKLPGEDAPRAIELAFRQSTDRLPAEVRQLFSTLSCFATNEFGRHAALAAAAALSLPDPGRALDLLLRRALLDKELDGTLPAEADRERLRLHPLLRELAAEQLDDPIRAAASFAIATFYANYASATPDVGLVPDAANIAGALEWAHDYAPDQDRDALVAAICVDMQDFWHDRSRTRDSLRYVPWGIAAAERIATSGERNDQLRLARLQISYAEALITSGNLHDAEDYINRSLAIRRSVNDTHGEGIALSKLGDILVQRGDLAAAHANYERALAIMREVGDRHEEGVELGKLGDIMRWRGDLAAAHANYERALAIMREAGDTREEGLVLGRLGQIAQARGRLSEAEGYFQHALATRREAQDRRGEGVVLASLGQIALSRGRLEEAEGYFQQALAIDLEVQDRRGEGVDLANLGQIAQARGRLEEAEGYFQQALAIRREVQDRQGEGVLLSNLGQIAQARGRLEEAEDYFQEALLIHRQVQDRRGEGVVLAQLGLIARDTGKLDEAERDFRESLAVTREVQDAFNEGIISQTLGEFLIVHRNDRDEGCALLSSAVRIFHQMGVPDEQRARELARRLGCDVE